MNKNSSSFRNSGAYTSPGTPDYRDNNVGGVQKGWCSERVPLPNNGSRRYVSAAALMPFNSGWTLPSKWDDAERWITSPVLSFGVSKAVAAPAQRRPKSKSGPLRVAPGVAYFSNYSPAVPVLEGGRSRNFIARSPLTTGVLVADGLSIHYGGGINKHSNSAPTNYGVAQSSSVPGWPELLMESSLPSSQDDIFDGSKDAENTIWRRDMATQMSPGGSSPSSPKGRSSLSIAPPLIPPAVQLGSNHSAKVEIKDVQVDKGATMIKQSKRHGAKIKKKKTPDANLALTWDTAEGEMRASKYVAELQKEETRITAWENLQNAKAEAAIRKLEMKLEKKRSVSLDKILNKLRAAQRKAQEMRRSMTDSPARESPKTSIRRFYGCFTCHLS